MILEELPKYKDRFGLIQPGPPTADGSSVQSSENGLRFTSETILGLTRSLIPALDEYKALCKAILDCEEAPGIFRQDPESTLQNSQDNYIALLAASKTLRPLNDIAERILLHGETHGFIYRNLETTESEDKAWFFRFPVFIATCYFACRKNPPPLEWFLWCVITLWNTFFTKKDDQDGWMLHLDSVICAYGTHPITNFCCVIWSKMFRKLHPDGCKTLLTNYFGHYHPNADLLENEFGVP